MCTRTSRPVNVSLSSSDMEIEDQACRAARLGAGRGGRRRPTPRSIPTAPAALAALSERLARPRRRTADETGGEVIYDCLLPCLLSLPCALALVLALAAETRRLDEGCDYRITS
jgi:hypothetical protein